MHTTYSFIVSRAGGAHSNRGNSREAFIATTSVAVVTAVEVVREWLKCSREKQGQSNEKQRSGGGNGDSRSIQQWGRMETRDLRPSVGER